jgi:perosamine synthetase
MGSPTAEITVFSFGPIKTSTAFGGAVSIVRNEEILQRMREIQATYPVQPTSTYRSKIIKYTIGMIMLDIPFFNRKSREIAPYFNFDYKKFVVGIMRGFPPTRDFLGKFRWRPCSAMLSFLLNRLTMFSEEESAVLN